MPRFEPFAGLRYDPARVDMSAVVAPPYDVVGPEERARLAARHSANAIRVELPEPDHRAGLDRYANAARQLEQWQEDGHPRAGPGPSLLRLPDDHTGRARPPTASSGRWASTSESAAEILPHEQTLPKPKSDRLDLLRATRANLSPIWGLSLSPGPDQDLRTRRPAPGGGHRRRRGPPRAVGDRRARRHRRGARHGGGVTGGHRRRASPLRDGPRLPPRAVGPADGGRAGRPDGADLVMALVVELAEDQLDVGPIHRGLSGLPDGLDLVDAFSSWFDVTRAGDFDDRTTAALGESGALALVMPSGAWLLSPKDGTPEAAGADLDSSMVALVIAELPDHELAFFNSWEEAVDAVAAERAQAVVLLRPVTVEQIAEWAHAGRRMPPKSTYFHPKPRTGMVFRHPRHPALS